MLKISTYHLKKQFQNLLTPVQNKLITLHISANSITLFTCLLCIIYAFLLLVSFTSKPLLFALPLFMFLRMALNALDGMVAAKTQTQSALGSVLNEVCDVISDILLFGAFTILLPINAWIWAVLITLIVLTEFIALAVFQAKGIRPFSGPFGKSDRAVFLALVAILLLLFPRSENLFLVLSSIGIILSLITSLNRFKLSFSS